MKRDLSELSHVLEKGFPGGGGILAISVYGGVSMEGQIPS